MLSVLLVVVAAACFVIMIIALLVAIRLADRLERLEREYELLKESRHPDSRRRKRTPAHLVGVPDAKGSDSWSNRSRLGRGMHTRSRGTHFSPGPLLREWREV